MGFMLHLKACLLGTCLVGGSLAYAETGDSHSDELWRLVAQSNAIVVGVPRVPVEAVRASLASRVPENVVIDVACEHVLKGTPQQSVRVRFNTRITEWSPSPERVIAMDRKRAIHFLDGASDADDTRFFFAGHTPTAIAEADARLIAQIQAEVQEQRKLLEQFHALFPPKDEPLYSKVKDLIDATARKDTQMRAFADLEALGSKAVPAIIMLMDDRRELPEKAITLKNHEGHWEGLRHYGPKNVTDAMAAILNQITGEDFGPIYNGGTEYQRREAVNGWKIYLCRTAIKKAPR